MRVLVDINRNRQYNHALSDITSYVVNASGSYGWQEPIHLAYPIAPESQCVIVLSNHDGAFSPNGKLALGSVVYSGMLVKVLADFASGEAVVYEGYIDGYTQVKAGAHYRMAQVQLRLTCPLRRLYDVVLDIPVQTNISSSDAIKLVLDKAPVPLPYDDSWFVLGVGVLGEDKLVDQSSYYQISSGYEVFDYFGDVGGKISTSAKQYLTEAVIGELGGLFLFDPSKFQYVFFHRRHSGENLGQDGTIYAGNSIDGTEFVYSIAPPYSVVELNYKVRNLGVAGSVVASYPSLPLRIGAGSLRNVRLSFSGDNGEVVGVVNAINPDSNDIVVTKDEDGTQPDSLSYHAEIGARSANIKLYNSNNYPVYVQKLQIRGTPIINEPPQVVRAVNVSALERFGRVVYSSPIIYPIEDYEKIYGYANGLASRLGDVGEAVAAIIERIEISEPRAIGEHYYLIDEYNNHAGYYMVSGVSFELGAALNKVVYNLSRVDKNNYFIVGVSELGSLSGLGL